LLLKFWNFCNNEEQIEGDRLFKLSAVFDALVSRFQAAYTPEKELSIDESMVLWRYRLLFRQYIPGKRHKYGVKLYMLCESSGYVWNMMVYCGKSDPISGLIKVIHCVLIISTPVFPLQRLYLPGKHCCVEL